MLVIISTVRCSLPHPTRRYPIPSHTQSNPHIAPRCYIHLRWRFYITQVSHALMEPTCHATHDTLVSWERSIDCVAVEVTTPVVETDPRGLLPQRTMPRRTSSPTLFSHILCLIQSSGSFYIHSVGSLGYKSVQVRIHRSKPKKTKCTRHHHV